MGFWQALALVVVPCVLNGFMLWGIAERTKSIAIGAQAAVGAQIHDVHLSVNSRLDQLVAAKEIVAHAAGVAQGRDEQTVATATVVAAGRAEDRADVAAKKE